MKTITTHEAKTHLSRYLAEVEKGARFTIARGKRLVAMLVPVQPAKNRARPKVGRINGAPFDFPAAAFGPLTPDELKEWGL
jgi:antitoxin (DNA-binding transcriptional repressor) of toxin-antitoxin stability system